MIKERSRECSVYVTSCQIDTAGEKQTIETESKGRLSEKEGVLYVLYEESTDEKQNIKNLLKIEKEPLRVSLTKSGAVSWKIKFIQGEKDRAEYGTPYGSLEISVDTKAVTFQRTEQKISLQLVYTLFIQGEKQADCRLKADIRVCEANLAM